MDADNHYGNSQINLNGIAPDHLRLLIKVARLYHEEDVVQPEIARRLHISQPRVSRLLREAVSRGIVRTTVITPPGLHVGLEDDVARAFGLADVVVTDTVDVGDEASMMRTLGAAAADYLEPTLTVGDSIGISSWSATLSAMVSAMRPNHSLRAKQIVQILGGIGHATVQAQATRTTTGLAQLTGAVPIYLPAPGLVPDPRTRAAYLKDPQFKAALAACEELTVVLLGIGSLEPSPLLQESGNALPREDQAKLRALGAVGDVSMHFFDDLGRPVTSDLDERILGISADTMRAIPRRVGVAGGTRKYTAIRAALRGGWINVLITDVNTASRLAAETTTD